MSTETNRANTEPQNAVEQWVDTLPMRDIQVCDAYIETADQAGTVEQKTKALTQAVIALRNSVERLDIELDVRVHELSAHADL